MSKDINHSRPIKAKQEFKNVFDSYYPALCSFASNIILDFTFAEDLVQEVFLNLWEKPENLKNEYALKTYLYNAVKNKCLNYLEHSRVVKRHNEYTQNELNNTSEINNLIIEEETYRLIYNAINELPAQCKNVLMLSINGLKNSEIAKELNISENTVKTQKKIAYKQLKIKLKDIYSLIWMLFGSIL
ncbi:MAG: RNA polymerase sigma-70 factor [Bacteroidales bacterium]|nr:RNA polymerase sigma-70 factor [Bacteroidales bacterium]